MNFDNFNRGLIAPIVAVVLILIKSRTGFQFDDSVSNQITDAILAIVTLIGIFTHPTKKGE